jgi:hypothetical protein
MQRAREEVAWLFDVDKPAGATQDRVRHLLDHDRFMCGTGTISNDHTHEVTSM